MKERSVKIELTRVQTEQLKKQIGREVRALKLSLQELEQRVTPRLSAN